MVFWLWVFSSRVSLVMVKVRVLGRVRRMVIRIVSGVCSWLLCLKWLMLLFSFVSLLYR